MIIQTILLYPSGAVWTDEASNVSRRDPSGAVQADAKHPTRNRKVVGSNPTSGSKTAGQSTYTVTLSLVLLASLIILCVYLASGRARPPLAPLESVWLIQRPSMGPSSAHSGRNRGGRTTGRALRAGGAFTCDVRNQDAAAPPFPALST